MNARSIPALALVLPLLAGCVSQGTYDAAVAKQASTEVALAHERRELAELQAEQSALEIELAGKRIGGAVTKARLWLTRAHRDYLLRARAAEARRAAAVQEVASRLAKMIDAGDVKVTVRDGRMVIAMPNDVLFDSGQVEIKPRGKDALTEVAAALRTLKGRHLQVAGHTDNVPIANARYASNWELSSARSVEVVRFLMKQGVEPAALSAAGYAEFDPITANDGSEGRAKNRRIEITLMPEIEPLPAQ